MSKPSVYLAGPISGLTYDEGEGWRLIVTEQLAPQIDAFSPLRNKAYLKEHGKLEGSYDFSALSTARGITTRDRLDVMSRDLILVNFKAWKKPSLGTLIELGWADAARKPVVGLWEGLGNNIDTSTNRLGDSDCATYPMVQEIVDFWVNTIEEATDLIKAILLPGGE